QLFRIHSSNGDASLIQLTEQNEDCRPLASNDIHLEKLAFISINQVTGPTGECWLYDFESNETSYLGSIDSSFWPIHQTWSTDNSKMAIGEIWATGIYTPGPINIFDTVADSFTTLANSTWPPCFWVGETGEQVSIIDETLPITYNLYNAYPNPFNPATTIRYELLENGYVNITIYDMLGRQVKTLVNQAQDAGYRSIIWDATNDYGIPVSAGIYLYQIQAGGYITTKKMILLK
ncbi:MAG: T9SS type A sorting domain-containing protein, partial [Candidatus Marinimicrobia bacterium]|nr:T9SS type A sorting domain-containing protein [Candidatus Neomarinimicrobiota bacterium]